MFLLISFKLSFAQYVVQYKNVDYLVPPNSYVTSNDGNRVWCGINYDSWQSTSQDVCAGGEYDSWQFINGKVACGGKYDSWQFYSGSLCTGGNMTLGSFMEVW